MTEQEQPSILVVDDQGAMRRVIGQHLASAGYLNVSLAESGEEALAKLDMHPYDLVVLDWTMPGLSGLDVLKEVRSKIKWAQVKVMMVTAEGLKENVIAAVEAGANNYVVKPFTQETLLGKVAETLPERVKPSHPLGFIGGMPLK